MSWDSYIKTGIKNIIKKRDWKQCGVASASVLFSTGCAVAHSLLLVIIPGTNKSRAALTKFLGTMWWWILLSLP
jgi:hypothetical protein